MGEQNMSRTSATPSPLSPTRELLVRINDQADMAGKVIVEVGLSETRNTHATRTTSNPHTPTLRVTPWHQFSYFISVPVQSDRVNERK